MQVQCVPSAFLLVVFSGAVGCGGGRAATETDDAGAKTGAPDAGAMTGDGAGRSMGADATDGAGEPAVIDLVDPGGLFLDEQGNLFVSDTNSAAFVVPTVLKIALATDTTWLIASNEILSTQSMAGDGAGNLYLPTGHGNTIVRVRTDTGSVTTLAGSTAGYFDGVGAAAQFRTPVGIAIDGKGNLFVAEFENETIRKIEIATGTVTTVAGAPMQTGSASGAGSAARFHDPTNLAYDRSTDRLYVADVGNGLVRQIDIGTNMVTTLAGDGDVGSQTDGTGTSAEFDAIGAMVADGNGTLYVGDRATIRKVALAAPCHAMVPEHRRSSPAPLQSCWMAGAACTSRAAKRSESSISQRTRSPHSTVFPTSRTKVCWAAPLTAAR
jgi:DNA-binding beta-propeller fold protein YncE